MIRVGRPLIVQAVASYALRGSACELPVAVATEAIRRRVLANEGKRGMVENGAFPPCSTRMAELTIAWKSRRQMIRVLRGLKLSGVASETLRCCGSKTATTVALITIQDAVPSLQTEARRRLMVPSARRQPFPCIGGVALSAMRTELQAVRVVLSAGPMTCFAILWGPANDSLQMASTAFDVSVPSHQGETRVVVRLDQSLPDILPVLLRGDYHCRSAALQ